MLITKRMDNNQVYRYYSSEFEQANNCHRQLLSKEFELQIINVRMKYDVPKNNFKNQIERINLEAEIHNITRERDVHLNNAIHYVLSLANNEIANAQSMIISLAYMALSYINTFISTQNINLNLSPSIRIELIQISNKLISPNTPLLNLKSELDKLKSLCKI